jgi:hypothetical protein
MRSDCLCRAGRFRVTDEAPHSLREGTNIEIAVEEGGGHDGEAEEERTALQPLSFDR